MYTGADAQAFNSVMIIASPPGTPYRTNEFLYPILSSVTLTCTTDPPAPSASYRWNANCRRSSTECFPYNQMTQSVSTDSLRYYDEGNFTCTANAGGGDYTSEPFIIYLTSKLQQIFINIIRDG